MSLNNESVDKLRKLFRGSVITALQECGLTDEYVDEYISYIKEEGIPYLEIIPHPDQFENLINMTLEFLNEHKILNHRITIRNLSEPDKPLIVTRVWCNECKIQHLDVYHNCRRHTNYDWVWQCRSCCGEFKNAQPVEKDNISIEWNRINGNLHAGTVIGDIPSIIVLYVIQVVNISKEYFTVSVEIQIHDNDGNFSYSGIAKSEEEAKSRCLDMFNRIMRTI